MTDEQIIQELKAGKPTKAIKALYRYYPVVRQMVLKNNGSRQDAEDIYQETLIILFRKSKEENFRLTSSLSTFLFSISRFQWLNELRKRKKEAKEQFEEISEEEAGLFSNYLEEETQFKKAEQAVLKLGEKCRELLRLFYFEKLDFATIAGKIGFSNEKVAKNQKYRCLEKAREHYLSSNAKPE